MKERVVYLDYIRIMACMMVVLMHAPMPSSNAVGVFLSSVSYFTSPCIGLFFMVSGALLLPSKESTGTFLRKRFLKIVYPVILWSLIYMGINWNTYSFPKGIIEALFSLPFSPQGNSVLWFMYVLMGLYLITPIISRWLEHVGKKEIEFYLILWLVTLCYPILELFLSINDGKTGILYYSSGYLGYYVLGYYLNRYSFSLKIISTLFLLSLGCVIYCKIGDIDVDFYRMFWYLSIFSAVQCALWFLLLKRFFEKHDYSRFRRKVQQVAALTFGIYLMHILIMRSLLWQVSFIQEISNYIVQSLLVAVLTFVLSLGCTYLISLLPGGGYLIGYKQKRVK